MSRKFKIRRKRGPTVAKVFPVTGRPGNGFKKFTRAHEFKKKRERGLD